MLIEPGGRAGGHAAFGQGLFQVAEVAAGQGLFGVPDEVFQLQREVAFVIAVGDGFSAYVLAVFEGHVVEQVFIEQAGFQVLGQGLPFGQHLTWILVAKAQDFEQEGQAVPRKGKACGIEPDEAQPYVVLYLLGIGGIVQAEGCFPPRVLI